MHYDNDDDDDNDDVCFTTIFANNTVWSKLRDCIRANSLQTEL